LRIVDISQGWREGMPKFEAEWYPRFEIERVMTPTTDPAKVGRTFSRLSIFPHNGSHVESSFHFDPRGVQIDDVPLDAFVGWACVADVSYRGDLEAVTARDLEESIGELWSPGHRLLIRTDHPQRHLDRDDYWDTPPYLDLSAAEWAVENGASLIGLDCIAEKPGDLKFPVHRRVLESGIPLLENIANLHELSEDVVWLFAPPIKIADMESAPARAVVVEGMPRSGQTTRTL
jgi:arylformamidase